MSVALMISWMSIENYCSSLLWLHCMTSSFLFPFPLACDTTGSTRDHGKAFRRDLVPAIFAMDLIGPGPLVLFRQRLGKRTDFTTTRTPNCAAMNLEKFAGKNGVKIRFQAEFPGLNQATNHLLQAPKLKIAALIATYFKRNFTRFHN